ncbi:MAG: sulfurtransferase [Thiohalomonadaceae bacterium]
MTGKASNLWRWRAGVAVGLTCVAAMVLTACGTEDSASADQRKNGRLAGLKVNTPAEIAQVSAVDYDENENGLITANTLRRWIADWELNRPAGIKGKLVILQLTPGPAGAEFIKSNKTNVFTYHVPSGNDVTGWWTQTRDNGVIETTQMVPDGPKMDALLQAHDIDPQNDMIVCAMGTGSTSNAMAQGRCWYALRYWGVDAKNLAALNGGNQYLAAGDAEQTAWPAELFMPSPDVPSYKGTASVRDLKVDNTALQATLDDMMAILTEEDRNNTEDGVFLWDARNLSQYSAGQRMENGENTGTTTCADPYCDPEGTYDYMNSFQNNGSKQGHPNGALQLQFTRLLDATKGFAYRPKAELEAYMQGETVNGIGFLDGTYAPVGPGQAYQAGDVVYTYCETTFRAMITGFASAAILGYPTRFYDGAMVEWNSLSHKQTRTASVNGDYLLPVGSPWRTDLSSRSFFRYADDAAPNIAVRNVTNAYAATADAVILADKAYKDPAPAGNAGGAEDAGSGGGSIGLPPNPCGG